MHGTVTLNAVNRVMG